MRSAFFVFALGGMFSLSCATNLPNHPQLVSRQSGICLPVFRENPTSSDVPCGGNQEYVAAACHCCRPGASGTIGCDAFHVCSADAYGNTICCPEGEPDCGQASSPATPTTDSSDSPAAPTTDSSDSPAAPTTDSSDSSSSDPTSTVQNPITTSSSGQSNTGTASGSSSSTQSSSGDASTYCAFLWQPLVLVVALVLV